jgi:hypothetical protein
MFDESRPPFAGSRINCTHSASQPQDLHPDATGTLTPLRTAY